MTEDVNVTGKSRSNRIGGDTSAARLPAAGIAAILARTRQRASENDGSDSRIAGENGGNGDSDSEFGDLIDSEARIPGDKADGTSGSGGRNSDGGSGGKRKRGRPRKYGDNSGGPGTQSRNDGRAPNASTETGTSAPGDIRLEPVQFPKRGRPKKAATLSVASSEVTPLLGVAFALAAQLGGNHWLLRPEEMAILSDSLSKALSTIKNESMIRAVEGTVGVVPWITLASVSAMIILPRIQESRKLGGANVKAESGKSGVTGNSDAVPPVVPGPDGNAVQFPERGGGG